MGKTALFFVAAFSMAGARLLYTSQEADIKSAANQGEYSAEVIAREIARSAYNAATADVHRYGTDIDRALANFGTRIEDDCANSKPVCFRRTGEMSDGTYIVEASIDGGNGVDIYTSARFSYDQGDRAVVGEHEINESESVGVLQVADRGTLNIQFVDSMAGHCSAIFLQRTIPGRPAAEQPGIEMVYAPGKNRNGDRNVGLELELDAGTQMNFAIGVDDNCGNRNDRRHQGIYRGTRPSDPAFADLRMDYAKDLAELVDPDGIDPDYGLNRLAELMDSYVYDSSDWAWTHWALDASALRLGDPQEAPRAMVETDPRNNQRWRIAFEDLRGWNLESYHRDYHNPNKSLWATKQYGYDWSGDFLTKGTDGVGNGWTDNVCTTMIPNDDGGYDVTDTEGASDGFHDLRDTSSPADFSDQVIMVEIVPPGESFDETQSQTCLDPA